MVDNVRDALKASSIGEDLIRRPPIIYARIRRFLLRIETVNIGERRRFIHRQLTAVRRAAMRTEHYRSQRLAADPADWPHLSKEAVRDHPSRFFAPVLFPVSSAATGGTTGVPMKLRRSWKSVVAEQVALDALAAKGGIRLPNARIAVLRGDTIRDANDMTPPFWEYRARGRILALSAHHLCAATVDQYFRELKNFAPQVLTAYPSALEALCGHLEDRNTAIPGLRLVLCSSEVLRAELRERAERLLGARLFDYYGQAERCNFVTSTETGAYYFQEGYGLNELVWSHEDSEHDCYEIVGTSLWNTAQVLLRYKTGDMAMVPRGSSAKDIEDICHGMKPFLGIAGRDSEYIETPDGRRIIGINQIPRGLEAFGVVQMQIVQQAKDSIDVYVVARSGDDARVKTKMIERIRTKVPEIVHIRMHFVDRIARTERGKAPLVMRRLSGVS